MTTLVLIRHGQASFGQADYDVLSDRGHRQGALTGSHFAELGLRFDALLTGDMSRQVATAQAAAEAIPSPPPIERLPAFNEYDADGLFRAYLPQVLSEDAELAARKDELFRDRKVFQRAFVQVAQKWLAGEPHEVDGFEDWASFRQRVTDGLAHLHSHYDRDARIALFTSGGPVAVAVAAALGLDDWQTLEVNWTVYNASVSEFRSRKRGWRLMSFNNITHLRLRQEPELITHR